MSDPNRRARLAILIILCVLSISGCGRGLETDYGKSQGLSINGSAVLAEMFRQRGDEVKTAFRLTEQVGDWADVIVRFARRPGLPEQNEADWYSEWLGRGESRSLIYVVRDFDAEQEYWDQVIREFGPETVETVRKQAETKRDEARKWLESLPEKAKRPAGAREWFRIDKAIEPPRPCKALGGPWAEGLDAELAAISIHEPFAAGEENILLTGEGHPLAISWKLDDDTRILAIANGSFLLNEPLVNPGRRKLASRVLEWSAAADGARRVAFVQGDNVTATSSGPPTIWDLIGRVASFRWVAIQMGLLGVAACLTRAARLGRPRPEPMGKLDRPSAHVEAIGDRLARSASHELSEREIEHYRAWRRAHSAPS